jgi:hypothetical protein
LFDKRSSDFCFEKSREILSKPFTIDLNASSLDKRYFDKKTRDLIGENLMDIEKTLNALNLDFLQAFNELEKTDSAETLFGENFLLENNLKSSTMTKLSNNYNNNNFSVDKKSSKDFYSPLDKRSSTPEKSFSSPKDSSQRTTPSSFSPQESTVTSRGFFFNYPGSSGVGLGINRSLFLSPTKRMGFSNSAIQKSLQQQGNSSFQNQMRNEPFPNDYTNTVGPRQRSMSFTENFEVKSPISMKAQSFKSQLHPKSMDVPSIKQTFAGTLGKKTDDDLSFILPTQSQLLANKPRNIITYKPKSIRARNLRRLSYNPINMVDSSSSSSESDLDRSMALSECDIRSKMHHSRYYRRRYQQQYHRKLNNSASSGYYDQEGSTKNTSKFNSSNSSNMAINGRNKLYGSNASIKSAPQYNYMSDRKKYLREDFDAAGGGYDDKGTLSSDDLDSDEDLDSSLNDRRTNPFKVATAEPQKLSVTPTPPTSNLNNIYDFVGKCFNRNRSNTELQQKTQPPYKFLKNKNTFDYGNIKGNKISSSNLDLLYTEFDVSKLTGKSPTTQSYFDIMNYSNNLNNKKKETQQLLRTDSQKAKSVGSGGSGTFQWPEKIDGSTVKQNDLIWQLQKQHEQDLQEKQERQQQAQQTTQVPVPITKILMENYNLRKTAFSSDTSSDTETNSIDFRQDYVSSRMPPSPAP